MVRKLRAFVKLRTQGNSLVITIPKDIREFLGWKEGDLILIRLEKTAKTYFDSKIPRRLVAEKVEIEE